MANWPIQQEGAVGENVRTVQFFLNDLGVTLTVDGDFGPLTKSAVEWLQTGKGLQVDGIVGEMTWPVLISPTQIGFKGPSVSAVQSQVDSRVDILAIDGDFGSQTDGAVRAFQGPTGLAVDGIAGLRTWNALVNGYLTARSGEDAAQAVFDAWANNDPGRAAKDATPGAVSQLFAQAFASATWTFESCSGAAGSIGCVWKKAGGGELVLLSNNNAGAPFYYVRDALFR
jgi:hypothetical protein